MMSSVIPSNRPGAAEMVRLPLRVHPENDETILSIVVRLAAENKFDHVFGLTALAGLPSAYIDRLARVPVDMMGLAYASGISENRLRYMQYLPVDTDHVAWLGRPVRRQLVRTKHRRWCPACLWEKPYHRAHWDLLPIGVCHQHKLALASQCPKCRERVRWPGKSIVTCRCGGNLTRVVVAPVSDAAAATVQMVLDGLDREVGSDDLWLATTLGWLSRPGQIHQPTERTLWWRVDDMAGLLEIGWAALQDWPTGFEVYLARHMTASRDIWPIVRWVERQYVGPKQADMSKALKEHSRRLHRQHTQARLHASLHAHDAH